MKLGKLFSATLVVLLANSCSHLPPGVSESHAPEELAHELQADVQHLAGAIGERNLYHPEKLEAASDWIESEFLSMGYSTVCRQPVVVRGRDFALPEDATVWNIEAILPGGSLADEHLIIGAHYDSKVAMPRWHGHWPPNPENKGTPGANDNASGMATVLALARRFAGHPQERTIHFVAFVNEEPPFYQTEAMGSLVYARSLKAAGLEKVRMFTPETLGCYSPKPHRKRIGVASLFGLPDRHDYVAFVCNLASRPWVTDMAKRYSRHSAKDLRTLTLPALSKKGAWSDDWAFWQCGYPAFAVTDTAYFRSDQYHDLSDTPEALAYGPMAQVVKALGTAVEEAASDPAHCPTQYSLSWVRM